MASPNFSMSVTDLTAVVVTAAQMRQIESRLLEAGMPVEALMEKAAGRLAAWISQHYPRDRFLNVGVLVGPGHNGGDALVVARELYAQGYEVVLWCPFSQLKDLTASHWRYLEHLGIIQAEACEDLQFCEVIVDGGFGFGLTRPLAGAIAATIDQINQWSLPVVSIDLPSGLHTDTGQVMGTAVRATHTLCLGLWKRGFFQDGALDWLGQPVLIPFDIPPRDVAAVLGETPAPQRLSQAAALAHLPLPRAAAAHKYRTGHLLLVAGSARYGGAALLAGAGAIASGVGMLTLIVPERLKPVALGHLPEALIVGAPETAAGAIAALPSELDLARYDAIASGPGMTPDIDSVMAALMDSDRPLVLDADALNWLAQQSPVKALQARPAATLLTPHPGEFRRLFAEFLEGAMDPAAAAQAAAQASQITLVLKGAKTAIAHRDQRLWFNPDSTTALARGGSGDVLTGLLGGLAAQRMGRQEEDGADALLSAAIAGVWWHATTAQAIAQTQTVLGCPPSQLAAEMPRVLAQHLSL